MTASIRRWIFLACAAGFAALYGWGLTGLPAFGHYQGPYGDIINALTVSERQVTDAVTAVTVDFRGFDTLGEENIMFISVMGVALLLRKQKSEKGGPEQDKAAGRTVPRASDAVRTLSVALVGTTVLFGIYVVVHGQVSPGGGFQGGVILATAPLLVYLAGNFSELHRIAPHWLVEVAEAVGVAGYAALGLIGYFSNTAYLTNVLPLGTAGELVSGGLVPFINMAIGLAVSAGFIMLMLIFLAETLSAKDAL